MIRTILIGAATAAALAAPAAAQAETFCVKGPCASRADTTHQTIYEAVDAAKVNGSQSKDRIELGAGDIPVGGILQSNEDNPITIVGLSRQQTRLIGQGNEPALRFYGQSTSTVSDLEVVTDAQQTGLDLRGTSAATNVLVTMPTTAENVVGVRLGDSASLARSTVATPMTNGSRGIVAEPDDSDDTLRISDVIASGSTALSTSAGEGATVDARRLRLSGWATGAEAYSTSDSGGTFKLSNSVITMAAPIGSGLTARLGSVEARHLTIVKTGTQGTSARGVSVLRGPNGGTNRLDLRDSIIAGFNNSIVHGDDVPANVSYSLFDKSTVIDGGTGYTADASNVNGVAPGLASGTYQLAAGSAAIDAGTPGALGADESIFDLAGATRLADGNGDGRAVRDMGAYEYPAFPAQENPGSTGGSSSAGPSNTGAGGTGFPVAAPSDATAPVFSSVSLSRSTFSVASASTALTAAARGTTLRYRLSEPARVRIAVERRGAGASVKRGKKRVCLARTKARGKAKRCTRYTSVRTLARNGKAGANTLDFTGRLAGRALKPGRYRFVITATDSAGNRSMPRTIAFRIVR